jgi:hypothetical protein
MAPVRFLRDALARWARDTRDGFWNCLDWLGF